MHNETLNELQYHVNWDEKSSIVMAYNAEIERLKIQGPVPYAAKELEEDIAGRN